MNSHQNYSSISSMRRRPGGFKKLIALVTLLSFLCQPALASAELVADPNASSGNRPRIDSTANGLPLVQIADPSAAGVSRNQYTTYNVDPKGVILNNSRSLTLTQQAGYVDANPFLTKCPARIILNEVTGVGASQLRGYTEVAGQKAEVVIANPNGITCNGCGFINASRGVLTTGTPQFGGSGSLEAFRVTKGNITVEGAGLNAGNLDQVDLIGRAVNINAGLWANYLNVITGSNRVGYSDLSVQPIAGDGPAPDVSLDVSALGGMYANKIRLVGTEQGVGVNSRGVMASAGDFDLTSEGRIVLSGSTSAGGALTIRASGDMENQGALYSMGNLGITADGYLLNNGTLATQGNLALRADSVTARGIIASGVTPDGAVGASGDMTIFSTNAIDARTLNLIAAGGLSLDGTLLDLSGGTTQAGQNMSLVARTGNINNTGGTIRALGNLTATAAQGIDNSSGAMSANNDLTLNTNTLLNNSHGTIGAGNDGTIQAASVSNTNGQLLANRDLSITALNMTSGHAIAGQDLLISLSSDYVNAAGDELKANRNLNFSTSGNITNQGTVSAVQTATLSGGTLTNEASGRIETNALALTTTGGISNSGAISAAQNASLAGSALTNETTGKIEAGSLAITSTGAIANRGTISAAQTALSGSALTNASSGVFEAGALTATMTGDITNQGTISAVQTATLSGSSLTNASSGVLEAGVLSVATTGNITNQGLIDGNTVVTTSDGFTNTNAVFADYLTINANRILNDGGDLSVEGGHGRAVIAATESVNLNFRDSLTNQDGAWIFGLGDIAITGSGVRSTLLNSSATIEADNNLSVSAYSITNQKRAFDAIEILDPLTVTHTNESIPIPEGYEEGVKFVTPGYIRATASYTETSEVTNVLTNSPSGRLLAGNNIAITADTLNNNYSTIAAGNDLTINVATALNNTARGGFIVTHHVGEVLLIYSLSETHCDRLHNCWTNWPEYPSTIPYPYGDSSTQITFLPGAASITAGNNLSVNGSAPTNNAAINNTTQGPNGSSTNDGSLSSYTTSVSLSAPAPISHSTPVTPGSTNAPSPSSTATTQGYTFTIPQSALYTTHPDPSSHYLVETDPRFTNMRNFLSSDYMLERINYDPEHTQKRLGDGFYEQRLVLDEVTKATGRRYLDGYASAEDEYRALMDAGVSYAQSFNLKIGVGLTAEQMAGLTSDMVWLVEKEVGGQKVLAPVVYLSKLHDQDLGAGGALIAARDIRLKSAGDLTNSGTIKAGYRNDIFASNITNLGGMIDAGSALSLAASQDIVNKSGAISGGSVALSAGRDIKSETATETATYANGAGSYTRVGKQAVIESRGDLSANAGQDIVLAGSKVKAAGDASLYAERNIQVGSVEQKEHIAVTFTNGFYEKGSTVNILSNIEAGSNLTLVAKKDTILSGAQASAGSDLTLIAGGNVTLTAVKDSALLDNKLTFSQGGYMRARSQDETAIGTSLTGGGNVTIGAVNWSGEAQKTGQDDKTAALRGNVLIEGSNVTSKSGTVIVAADNDITIKETREYHESLSESKTTKQGMTSSKTTETRDFVSKDLAKGSSLTGANVVMQSGKDITIQGGAVAGGDAISLSAAGNVNITATQDNVYEEHYRHESKKGLGAGMIGAAGAVMGVPLEGIQAAGKSLAKNNDVTQRSGASDETVIGSNILASNNVTIQAGQAGGQTERSAGNDAAASANHGNITVIGSSITSESGAVTLSAENDIIIREARELHESFSESTDKQNRFDKTKTYYTRDSVKADLVVGSSLSGDTVTLASGNDLTLQGSSVVGGNAVTLAALGNVSILTARETIETGHEQSVKETGFKWTAEGGKVGFFIGSERGKNAVQSTSVDNVGSAVGSLMGNVAITAGKDARIVGSDIISSTGTDIVARNVSIESAYNTVDSSSLSESRKAGLAFDVGINLTTSVSKMYDSWKRSNEVQSDRLKALYQYQSAKTGYDYYQSTQNQGGGEIGASASLQYSTTRTRSVSETHSSTALGSHIISDGNLNITALGSSAGDGDITVIGGALQGKNVSLDAARDIALLSAANTLSNSSESHTDAFTIGVKAEAKKGDSNKKDSSTSIGYSVYANASGAEGNTGEYELTHSNSAINAQENLTIKSGRDTTLRGAQASANAIIADVAGNLNLESEQDVSTYYGRNRNVGGNGSIGVGSSWSLGANYSEGKTDSDYQAVNQQTGLFAGAGGFNINVGKNTDLKGAVIASAATEDKNKLSTDTLTWSNIENKAEYGAGTLGASVSVGSNKSGSTTGSASPIIGLPANGKDGNTTFAAISPGTIELRSQSTQETQQTLQTLSRDTDNANHTLNKIFDQKKVAEQQEFSRVFGEEANKLVGDIAKSHTKAYEDAQLKYEAAKAAAEQAAANGDTQTQTNAEAAMATASADMNANLAEYESWKDGSFNKIILHAVAGGVQASQGGGSALAGAIGGATSEASSKLTENMSASAQQWTSALAGAAAATLAGGSPADAATSASTALDAEKYNRQLHVDELQKIHDLAGGDKEQESLLLQAACAKVHCADQIPDSDPNKPAALAYQQGGEKLTEQLSILSMVERQDRQEQSTHLGLPDEYGLQPQEESRPGNTLFSYSGWDYTADKISANPRLGGTLQAVSGGFQLGIAVEAAPTCASIIGCGAVLTTATLGVDNIKTGLTSVWDNKYYSTDFNNTLQFMGIPPEWANAVELSANVVAPMVAATSGTKILTTVSAEANTPRNLSTAIDEPIFSLPTNKELEMAKQAEQLSASEQRMLYEQGYVKISDIPGGTPYTEHISGNGWVKPLGGDGWGKNPGGGIYDVGTESNTAKTTVSGVPSNANWAQTIFNPSERFSDTGIKALKEATGIQIETINELAEAIKSGVVKPSQIPVQYVVSDGQAIILNTRTGVALERAGLPRSEWYGFDVSTNTQAQGRLQNQLTNNGLTNPNLGSPQTPVAGVPKR